MEKIKRPTGIFLAVVTFAFLLYFLMIFLEKNVLVQNQIPTYLQMEQLMGENRPMGWLMWILGDMSEPNFYKSYLSGFGLLAGSFLAHYLYRKNSKYQGIAIAYGSGLWPWVIGASTLSLILSNLLYGWNVANGWFPTFVTFVSCAAATVLLYGGSVPVMLTGAVTGAVLVTPISSLVMDYVCAPAGLPGVAGSVAGMWIGTAIACEIYRFLPWLHLPQAEPAEEPEKLEVSKKVEAVAAEVDSPETQEAPEKAESLENPPLEPKHANPNQFFVRRILADFSEPYFAGNEIAGTCLILGAILSWLLCPALPVYGSGTFAAVVAGEFLTGAVAMYVYWDQWMEKPWFPTFPSMVSVAPALAWLSGGSLTITVIAAVLGGILCPPIAEMVIRNLPKHWPSVVGTTFSMTVGAIVAAMFVTCAKGILPFV